MKNFLIYLTWIFILSAMLMTSGCGSGESRTEVADSIYSVEYLNSISIDNPERALALLDDWLESINYKHLTSGITGIGQDWSDKYTAYSISGMPLLIDAESTGELAYGIYIVNGKKVIISK